MDLGIKEYPLLFATVVGSRGFDCATEDSDMDIHGVHLLSVASLLGFDPGKDETIERKEECTSTHPKLEIATHDLRKFCRLMVKGNGNVLEDLFSPVVLKTSSLHNELKEMAEGCFSKKCANHYLGMAKNQQHNLANNGVKKVLHMYRCYLTGLHLMLTKKLEIRLPVLGDWYQDKRVREVIQAKQEGRMFSETEIQFHLKRLEELMTLLEKERDGSSLPDETFQGTKRGLEAFVIAVRLSYRED